MGAAVHIAVLELRRRLRDRSLIIQGVVGPIVLAGIIGLAFGSSSTDNLSVSLGIADEDESSLSTQWVAGLRAVAGTPDGPPVTIVDLADAEAAATAVTDDVVDAALVIPSGFEAGATSIGDVPPLVVFETGSRRISADIATATAEQLAAGVDGVRLATAAAALSSAGPFDLEEIADPAALAAAAGEVVEEPVGGDFNAVAFFAPSMAILFLFFTVGAGARSILRERADGTLARVRASPVSDRAILAGKSTAVLVAGIVSLGVVWAVTSLVFRADWGAPAGVAMVLVGTVVAVAGIAAILAGFATTEAQADATTAATAFVLALVGGNFIGPGAMPDVLERVSLATPNGWALRALTELSAGGATAADVAVPFVVLLAMGLVTGGVGTVKLAGRLA